ncbi:MAG: MAPEG family protein [Pseudobdellovibrionaceae bacterium]
MNSNLIFPMFAMFALSAVVLIRMFLTRVAAVKSGQVKLHYFKVYQSEEIPEKMLQASRHFSNLFEAPVLFYVICILGILFQEGRVFVGLAWVYVAARAAHAYIHLGSNRVMHRMRAYGLGWLVLTAMWLLLLWHQL